MNLNYQRCPEDAAKVITMEIGISHDGSGVERGVNEGATILLMKGAIYGVTMAIKNGVPDDFVSGVAAGLSNTMGEDIHALCPVIGILCECFALMSGGTTVADKEGLVNNHPSKECPPWIRGYFKNQDLDGMVEDNL